MYQHMYFSQIKNNFKPYKFQLLNKFFFKDLSLFDEVSSLSKTERESLHANLDSEIDYLKNIKSVEPKKTGGGLTISRSTSNPEKKIIDSFTEKYQVFTKDLHFNLVKLLFDEASNTWKSLFELQDGKKIESVLMRFQDGRNSVCVSCQVGCPVGCVFCASGQMGFFRNLTSHEIVDQVIFWARLLKTMPKRVITKNRQIIDDDSDGYKYPDTKDNFERVSNVVYMGMGEPMLNYSNVVESLKTLTNPDEFGLGDRHITVSSSGYIPQLEKYMQEGLKTRLAISLHAPNQELREQLMPVAKIYSLTKLLNFCKRYEDYSHKRISYEYTMIDGVNDTEECARDLARLLRHRYAHVNLIPMNLINVREQKIRLNKSKEESVYKFYDVLKKYQIPATIRITMGDRIQAACGQLVNMN